MHEVLQECFLPDWKQPCSLDTYCCTGEGVSLSQAVGGNIVPSVLGLVVVKQEPGHRAGDIYLWGMN